MPDLCILGAGGFIGRHLVTFFGERAFAVTRRELDLLDQYAVDDFFSTREFKVVFHCAVSGGSRLAEDRADVLRNNVMMFETVVKHACRFEKLVYFSSGARFDRSKEDPQSIPTDHYGFSKFIVEKRAESIPNVSLMRIYGCFGVGELSTRFFSICCHDKHVVISQDRYFDFIWVDDLCRLAAYYVDTSLPHLPKILDMVYKEKLLLSELATLAKATYTIETEGCGIPYTGAYDPVDCEQRGLLVGIDALHEHFQSK